jgi:hypothetical protein
LNQEEGLQEIINKFLIPEALLPRALSHFLYSLPSPEAFKLFLLSALRELE